ncbi:MAG: hypothetical protein AAF430_01345 [Myxococcota bacterium]
MRLQTTAGKVLSFAFQTHPNIPQTLFRLNFGRREFTFLRGFLLPLGVLLAAVYFRAALPREMIYAPLLILPPFASSPEIQSLLADKTDGVPQFEGFFFLGLLALFLATGLIHLVVGKVQRVRNLDPVNTYFWGESWLMRLPGLRSANPRHVLGKGEPLLLLALGYALCAVVPAFGLYLTVSGIVYYLEQRVTWNALKSDTLDARDALVSAQVREEQHEYAQWFLEQAETRAAQQSIPLQTLAEIHQNPHRLLDLSADETLAVTSTVGPEEFLSICDQLSGEEQERVFSRLPIRRPQSKTA